MDEHLPDGLRELLALRLEGSLTSNAKYLRAVRGVTSDGALKGTLQFAGALRTARWAGRLFQPQNLPRPTMPKKDIADGIKSLKLGVADLLYPSVPRLASNVIRGLIIPRGGHRLHVADLSNIEGRGLAALSGESWKLRAFAESDADKTKPDLYKAAYARSFGVDAKTVTDAQRQIGKVQELALGYEGGVGAFITMAATYRMDLQALAEAVHTVAPVDALKEAAGMWEWAQSKQRTLGLDRSVYVACETLKALWRAAHPNVVRFWKALKESSILAVENPGAVFEAGALKIKRENNWLRIRLPSGRYLSYLQPRVVDGVLSYVGVDSYTRSWKRIKTYGGKLAENATQAWARDIMAHNMPAVEQAGYNILLTVHDELITEAPVSRRELNCEGLAKLLAANPPWAADVPLKASGFSADRYEKG
jgi:DNA polymerase